MLRGAGGVAITLPVLEGIAPRRARADGNLVDPYAIFFRQANGVAAAQNTNEIGSEPERFWPTEEGPITLATLPEDRALHELVDFRDRLLAVNGVNKKLFGYDCGHAMGLL